MPYEKTTINRLANIAGLFYEGKNMNIETVNEIERLAEQHGMTVEFVTWFSNEKKAECGNVWFMMLAAMWEGWKGRGAELTAALATIEKCREIVGCPAGVDLQDHLRQLAAENVGLKAAINAVNRTAEECEVNGDELKYVVEPSEFEALIDFLDETPATDRIVAGIKADGVDLLYASKAAQWPEEYLVEADEFAAQLRNGGAS